MKMILSKNKLLVLGLASIAVVTIVVGLYLYKPQEVIKTAGLESSSCDEYKRPGGYTAEFAGHGISSFDELKDQADVIMVAKVLDCGPETASLKKGKNTVDFNFSVVKVAKGTIDPVQLPVEMTVYVDKDSKGHLESRTPLFKRGQTIVLFLSKLNDGHYAMFREGNELAFETNSGKYMFSDGSELSGTVFSFSELK